MRSKAISALSAQLVSHEPAMSRTRGGELLHCTDWQVCPGNAQSQTSSPINGCAKCRKGGTPYAHGLRAAAVRQDGARGTASID